MLPPPEVSLLLTLAASLLPILVVGPALLAALGRRLGAGESGCEALGGTLAGLDLLEDLRLLGVPLHDWHSLGVATLLLALGLLVLVLVLGGGAAIEAGPESVLVDLFELRTEALIGLLRRVLDLELLNRLTDLGLVAGVVSQRDAEELSHVSQHLNVEVVVFELAARGPEVTDLQGERVDQLEVFPHDDTPARLLLLLNVEVATVKAEDVGVFRKQKREDALLQPVRPLVRAAVHE